MAGQSSPQSRLAGPCAIDEPPFEIHHVWLGRFELAPPRRLESAPLGIGHPRCRLDLAPPRGSHVYGPGVPASSTGAALPAGSACHHGAPRKPKVVGPNQGVSRGPGRARPSRPSGAKWSRPNHMSAVPGRFGCRSGGYGWPSTQLRSRSRARQSAGLSAAFNGAVTLRHCSRLRKRLVPLEGEGVAVAWRRARSSRRRLGHR